MRYSFVIPCYGSEKTIGNVVSELLAEIGRQGISDYEVILVCDGSPDHVWEAIGELCGRHAAISGICLSRNFGQHAALLAGYARCTGDFVVSLDDDGQAPINELQKLIHAMDGGYDVVYAYYDEVKQTLFRRLGSKVAIGMDRALLGAPRDFKGSSFYIARRFVIEEMVKYENAYPYLLGLTLRVTRNIGYVQTSHRTRASGRSGYGIRKLLSLWVNGFTAFSVKPLEAGVWIGVLFSLAGFAGGAFTVIHKICHPNVLVGWSSVVSILLAIGGMVLLMLGLIGEYIGRIYICINKAPQYVIREEKAHGGCRDGVGGDGAAQEKGRDEAEAQG